MEKFYFDSIYHASKIIPLPFIKNSPSDYDTILILLAEAARQYQKQNQKFVFFTFDQPLYYKDREILTSVDPENGVS